MEGGREGGRDRRNRKNWELGVREASHTHESSARREEGCPRPVSGPVCPESACHPHHGKEEEETAAKDETAPSPQMPTVPPPKCAAVLRVCAPDSGAFLLSLFTFPSCSHICCRLVFSFFKNNSLEYAALAEGTEQGGYIFNITWLLAS